MGGKDSRGDDDKFWGQSESCGRGEAQCQVSSALCENRHTHGQNNGTETNEGTEGAEDNKDASAAGNTLYLFLTIHISSNQPEPKGVLMDPKETLKNGMASV